MARIFISYKRADKDKVFPIVEEIKRNTGVDCWIDLEGIESGDQFQNVIIDAIDNADIVVLMLSKNFIAPYRDEKTGEIDMKKQTFPEKEVMYALNHNKRLIPLSIDGTRVNDCKWLEFNCSGLDWIMWSDSEQQNKLFHNIDQWCEIQHRSITETMLKKDDPTDSKLENNEQRNQKCANSKINYLDGDTSRPSSIQHNDSEVATDVQIKKLPFKKKFKDTDIEKHINLQWPYKDYSYKATATDYALFYCIFLFLFVPIYIYSVVSSWKEFSHDVLSLLALFISMLFASTLGCGLMLVPTWFFLFIKHNLTRRSILVLNLILIIYIEYLLFIC